MTTVAFRPLSVSCVTRQALRLHGLRRSWRVRHARLRFCRRNSLLRRTTMRSNVNSGTSTSLTSSLFFCFCSFHPARRGWRCHVQLCMLRPRFHRSACRWLASVSVSKYTDIAVRSLTRHTAAGTHVPYRITVLPATRLTVSKHWRTTQSADGGDDVDDDGLCSVMKSLEFSNMTTVDSSNQTAASTSSDQAKTLETLLLEKNRALQTENTQLKVASQDLNGDHTPHCAIIWTHQTYAEWVKKGSCWF